VSKVDGEKATGRYSLSKYRVRKKTKGEDEAFMNGIGEVQKMTAALRIQIGSRDEKRFDAIA
jgi:hypothetical protein